MFKKFTLSDSLMLVSAFLSLIFSEYLWFKGEKEAETPALSLQLF
jgi:hypothetical protein